MREGLRLLFSMGLKVERPYLTSLIADALSEQGEWKKAMAISERAVTEIEESGNLLLLTDVYRIKGHIYLRKKPKDVEKAQECFRTAIAISQQHKMPVFEQRALKDLG
jgi:tetratricopeptide (TPR) repeat protein